MAQTGTKTQRGANFFCLMSGAAISPDYIKSKGKSGKMRQTLIAIVAEGKKGRIYVAPNQKHMDIAFSAKPEWRPETKLSDDTRNFWTVNYGLDKFGDLFTDRQLVALNTFSNLLNDVRQQIERDGLEVGLDSVPTPLHKGGTGAKAYAEAVSVYLSFAVSKLINRGSAVCTWRAAHEISRETFMLQAIRMAWDFAEINFFSRVVGNWFTCIKSIEESLTKLYVGGQGYEKQCDAQSINYPESTVISTDPPYYDNIAYADLADFFYCWLRLNLRAIYPDLFAVMTTPKADELVAMPHRHGGKEGAENFFLRGMKQAMTRMVEQTPSDYPATIYYAFKQKEISSEGIVSTGWVTFLQAVLESGYIITGTWPMRTEMANRMLSIGTNALANSVVLVCRKRLPNARTISRVEFIRGLERDLPPAIDKLRQAHIAPTDLPQAAIGPGMAIFSHYAQVLEIDDTPMTVKTALQLINKQLDDYFATTGDFDNETRFALIWFEQFGFDDGEFGTANNLAQSRGLAVEAIKNSGIIESAGGRVRLKQRAELGDEPTTVWGACQYLIHLHQNHGVSGATSAFLRALTIDRQAIHDLAYQLYNLADTKRQAAAAEAYLYNALVADWVNLTQAADKEKPAAHQQAEMNL